MNRAAGVLGTVVLVMALGVGLVLVRWLVPARVPLTSSPCNTYYKDRWTGDIYYCSQHSLLADWGKLDVDIDSFQVLSEKYAKDRKHVYYSGRILEKADVKTFKVVPNEFKYKFGRYNIYVDYDPTEGTGVGYSEGDFALDTNSVYFNERSVGKNSYTVLKNIAPDILLADDEVYLYESHAYGVKRIQYQGLDTATLRPFSSYFWADKNNVYCYDISNGYNFYVLNDLDPKKFRFREDLSQMEGNVKIIFGDDAVFYSYQVGCKRLN